jgi:diguanylate cyclase (GGDEF)-like protein/PAS domain S-box-containing protein
MQNLNNSAGLGEPIISLFKAIPDAIFVEDCNGRWQSINNAANTVLKLHNIDGVEDFDVQFSTTCSRRCDMYEQCLADNKVEWQVGNLRVLEEQHIDTTGNCRDYEIHKLPIFHKDGKRKKVVIIWREVTDKKMAERNLRVADAAIESQEAIVITDVENRILRVNNAFTRMTGYSREEAVGKKSSMLKSGRHDKAFYEAMWEVLIEKKFWQGEIWDRRKNGQIYLKWLSITAVAGSDGKVHNYVGSFTDLSEQRDAKEAIYRLAFYDPLTNLPNRRLFQERITLTLGHIARNLYHGAILMIDLDNFKFINDTNGYAVGDLLLVETAHRLKSCVRDDDTVSRIGGDEFVVMLAGLSHDPDQAVQQAEVLSNKILKVLNQPFVIGGETLLCTPSIGIQMLTMATSFETSDEVLKRADIAMYQAKTAGRNTYRFFDPEVQSRLKDRQAIKLNLRNALSEDRLKLYYQPQVKLGNIISGAEILLRWDDPQRGLMLPEVFIPIAEESGLILAIGEWTLKTACKQLKLWEADERTRELELAVNISARQFTQPDFAETVCNILNETGANGHLLKLELTESLMLRDVADTINIMTTLRQFGIQFSIDDFGTGYSSLSYLTKLPVSQLKIDRSFVVNIDSNPNDAIVAQTIIGMANNLDFNVIAEGVETESQRACLEMYGCTTYQGFLYSKPVTLAEFESMVGKIMLI